MPDQPTCAICGDVRARGDGVSCGTASDGPHGLCGACCTAWLGSLAEDAASGAAEGGHLDALKWLVSMGCPWSGSVWNYAVKGRHEHVVEWLRGEGCGGL